jgi:hypothetical protein
MGCNELDPFDPALLFTLEDYAEDENYGQLAVSIVNDTYKSIRQAKAELYGNYDGVPFTENVPAEWELISGIPVEDSSYVYNDFYIKDFQGMENRFIRFDKDVPAGTSMYPAKVEYIKTARQVTPGGTFSQGDSVSVYFQDDYENRSLLNGDLRFNDLTIMPRQVQGFTQVAVMSSLLDGTIEDMVSGLNNPAGRYNINGIVTIQPQDLSTGVILDVSITGEVYPNGNGNLSIFVEGEERARIEIQGVSTEFTGKIYTARSGFSRFINF